MPTPPQFGRTRLGRALLGAASLFSVPEPKSGRVRAGAQEFALRRVRGARCCAGSKSSLSRLPGSGVQGAGGTRVRGAAHSQPSSCAAGVAPHCGAEFWDLTLRGENPEESPEITESVRYKAGLALVPFWLRSALPLPTPQSKPPSRAYGHRDRVSSSSRPARLLRFRSFPHPLRRG